MNLRKHWQRQKPLSLIHTSLCGLTLQTRAAFGMQPEWVTLTECSTFLNGAVPESIHFSMARVRDLQLVESKN